MLLRTLVAALASGLVLETLASPVSHGVDKTKHEGFWTHKSSRASYPSRFEEMEQNIEGARQPDLANAHWLEAVQSRGWS
jgi:hypothetical protein